MLVNTDEYLTLVYTVQILIIYIDLYLNTILNVSGNNLTPWNNSFCAIKNSNFEQSQ